MTKLQNLFVALVNMGIFQMTLKFSLFTVVIGITIKLSLNLYRHRHAHKRLCMVLPLYSKIQVLPGITSLQIDERQ